jgi:hypothetical protein
MKIMFLALVLAILDEPRRGGRRLASGKRSAATGNSYTLLAPRKGARDITRHIAHHTQSRRV